MCSILVVRPPHCLKRFFFVFPMTKKSKQRGPSAKDAHSFMESEIISNFAEFRVYHATFSPCYHQISLPLFSLLNTYCHRFYWKKKLNYRSCIATENKCMVLYKVCLFTITWKIFKAWHQKSDAIIPIVSARRTKKCSFSSSYNIRIFLQKKF